MTAGFGHYGWVWIVALVAILAFALYRRGKRLIGHQRFSEKRLLVRMALFVLITIYALTFYARGGNPALEYESVAAGFVLGAIIAIFALRFTRMGRDERGVWYVPNLYLGIGLIALLVARFAYEYIVIFPEIRRQAEASTASGGAPMALTAHPMLHGVLFLVLGYYLIYYLGIVIRAHRLKHETPAEESPEK